jgi:hypothetical protein
MEVAKHCVASAVTRDQTPYEVLPILGFTRCEQSANAHHVWIVWVMHSALRTDPT